MEPLRIPSLSQVVVAVERLAAVALDDGLTDGPLLGKRLTTDCLRVVYRLAFAEMARRRGGVLTAAEAVDSLRFDVLEVGVLSDAVVSELARMLTVDAVAMDDGDPVAALGALHESVLCRRPVIEGGRLRLALEPARGTSRKAAGAYFTPPALAGWLLDHTLDPALEQVSDARELALCDPSCGAGIFLVLATRRLVRSGLTPGQALSCISGADVDAAAIEVARVCLWLEAVEQGRPVAMPQLALHAADALLELDWEGSAPSDGFDVVVGNPPFLNQLERLTVRAPAVSAQLQARSAGLLGPYTDASAVFLQRAVGWVRPGGRIGLVQPQSVLAARDAAGVRAYVSAGCSLEALWASDVPVFGAQVLTCAPVLRRDAPQKAVRRFHGPAFEELPPHPDPDLDRGWAFLLAAGLGIPEVALSLEHGVLGDIAECTADFRDQYYGLADYVHEEREAPGADVAPLVTSGLIDPAVSWWGQRSTRFLKRRWDAPVIDLDALRQDEKLHRWAVRRLVPKVLVGTQGKVIEAVVDEHGDWLPSVPTLTVAPRPDRLWHVLAVLLAPPVAAHAAATFAGTALSMRAIKLSAKQVAQLPLPADRSEWDLGALAVRRAQREPTRRREHLRLAAGHMCAAYGVGDATLDWWLDRSPVPPSAPPSPTARSLSSSRDRRR